MALNLGGIVCEVGGVCWHDMVTIIDVISAIMTRVSRQRQLKMVVDSHDRSVKGHTSNAQGSDKRPGRNELVR